MGTSVFSEVSVDRFSVPSRGWVGARGFDPGVIALRELLLSLLFMVVNGTDVWLLGPELEREELLDFRMMLSRDWEALRWISFSWLLTGLFNTVGDGSSVAHSPLYR